MEKMEVTTGPVSISQSLRYYPSTAPVGGINWLPGCPWGATGIIIKHALLTVLLQFSPNPRLSP